MNESLARLQPYPFEKLARLRVATRLAGSKSAIDLSIGESRHETPRFIIDALTRHLLEMARYPGTRGLDGLREAIARWLLNRFHLPPNSLLPEAHVLPVNGTREALFAIAQCVVDRSRPDPVVVMPTPFYQIYEGSSPVHGGAAIFDGRRPLKMKESEKRLRRGNAKRKSRFAATRPRRLFTFRATPKSWIDLFRVL